MATIATDNYDINEYNFVIHQGSTFRRAIIYKDDAGVAINLGTGASARMMVRKEYPATSRVAAHIDSPVLDLGTAGTGATTIGLSIATPTNGTVNIAIPATIMAAVPIGIYSYDLEVTVGSDSATLTSDDVIKILTGLFEVRQEATF